MSRDHRIGRYRRQNRQARLELLEDRTLLSISVGNTTVTEIKGGTNALFVVSLSAPSTSTITVDYYTADGTAVAGTDYTTTKGTVTFTPGQTGQVVSVPVLASGTFDPERTFTLNLLNPIGDTIAPGGGVGTATVIDNIDLPPQVSIANFTTTESTSGTTNATATITLSAASGLPTTVSYSTADITAVAGKDYVATSGSVTFQPGQTSLPITIPIIGSTVSKGTKTFAVNITSATNATIQTSQAIGTINDPNPPVGLSISNTTATQNASTDSTAVFTVQLAAPSAQTVTVQYATANGTATAGTSYVAASGTLTFTPGQTTATIPVTIRTSTVPEPTETFDVNLTSPVNSTISAGTGIGTIVNVVPGPNLSINNVQVVDSPTATVNAVFTVTLSTASALPVTVNYSTADVTAVAGSDYTTTTGTLTFPAGQTVETITVPVLPDPGSKPNRLFDVNLSGASNALISDGLGIGTIVDASAPPFLVINNVSIPEGASGTTVNAVFNVTMSSVSTVPVTVSYATADGTALAGTNYTATSGVLTFPAGQSVETITVPILGSNVPGNSTNFKVNLSGPTNATVALPQGTGTILNNNPAPTVSVNSVSATAPLAGTINADFTVSLTGPSNLPITVNYATPDATAQAGVDYTPESGTLTFAPGQTSKVVAVPILGQTVNKPTQTFTLNLSAPANATLGTSQGVGTILNTIAVPTVSIDDTTATVGTFTAAQAIFQVTLAAASGQPVTVNYATADGTATAGSDYIATSGTLTFAPGQTTRTITVPVLAAPVFKPDETFVVNLTAPVGAKLGQSQGTATIHDSNTAPLLSIGNTTVSGLGLEPTAAVFPVTLSAPSAATTTVDYATMDGSAVAGVDYTATSGTPTFAPGQTSQTISVPILVDLRVQGDTTFYVNLSNPTNATLQNATGIGTIIQSSSITVTNTNDDGPGSLREAIEESNATTPGPNTITFAIPGAGPFTINVRSALPAITTPVIIDGTTQPNTTGDPLVELNGAGAGADVDGLTIQAGDSTVKGLAIDQFTGSGIVLEDLGGDVIQGNYLGTNASGNTAEGNILYGVLVDNTPNNLIGGIGPGTGNVISGNALGGVYLGFAGSSGNQVEGNLIGTDATGAFAVPNGLNGVFVDNAPNNLIGGSVAGAGNVISGNDGNGVELFGKGSTLNRVTGNLIGVNAKKTAALVNGKAGLIVVETGRPHNIVTGPGLQRNLIVNMGRSARLFGVKFFRTAPRK